MRNTFDKIPVIAFSAWSGTGKTTIIEQVITRLKQLGFKVAAVKHDAHDFEIDKAGKDSWRFTKAGADITVINSANKTALIEQRSLNLSEIISSIHNVDLILLEGYSSEIYSNENILQIGINRKCTGKGFRLPPDRYAAVITDEEIDVSVPVFALDDIDGITQYILKTM